MYCTSEKLKHGVGSATLSFKETGPRYRPFGVVSIKVFLRPSYRAVSNQPMKRRQLMHVIYLTQPTVPIPIIFRCLISAVPAMSTLRVLGCDHCIQFSSFK